MGKAPPLATDVPQALNRKYKSESKLNEIQSEGTVQLNADAIYSHHTAESRPTE